MQDNSDKLGQNDGFALQRFGTYAYIYDILYVYIYIYDQTLVELEPRRLGYINSNSELSGFCQPKDMNSTHEIC